MNIKKYQEIVDCGKCLNPQQVRADLKKLLGVMEKNAAQNDAAVKVYNMLCGVDALLCRYETVCQETIFALGFIENAEDVRDYLMKIHVEANKHSIYAPDMICENGVHS